MFFSRFFMFYPFLARVSPLNRPKDSHLQFFQGDSLAV